MVSFPFSKRARRAFGAAVAATVLAAIPAEATRLTLSLKQAVGPMSLTGAAADGTECIVKAGRTASIAEGCSITMSSGLSLTRPCESQSGYDGAMPSGGPCTISNGFGEEATLPISFAHAGCSSLTISATSLFDPVGRPRMQLTELAGPVWDVTAFRLTAVKTQDSLESWLIDSSTSFMTLQWSGRAVTLTLRGDLLSNNVSASCDGPSQDPITGWTFHISGIGMSSKA